MEDMIRIMLVEDEAEICEGFRTALAHYPAMTIVYETDSESLALDYLAIHAVDVMILDVELNEGDGISLLEHIELHKLEKPFIMVVTNTTSKVILGYTRAHGADYVYQKENLSYSAEKVLGVIERVYPYQKLENLYQSKHLVEQFNQEKADAITLKYIENELEKIGFRRKHVGFTYAAQAILLLLKDKDGSLHVSSEIYPMLAHAHNTTVGGIERGIRNAIEATFTGARMHVLHQFYPFSYDENRSRPTNAEFLKNMASRLRL